MKLTGRTFKCLLQYLMLKGKTKINRVAIAHTSPLEKLKLFKLFFWNVIMYTRVAYLKTGKSA